MSFENEGYDSRQSAYSPPLREPENHHNPKRNTLLIIMFIFLIMPFLWIPIVLIIDLLSVAWMIVNDIGKAGRHQSDLFASIWQPHKSQTIFEDQTKSIILWWEKRRILYTITAETTVIASVLLSFVSITNSGVLQPGEDAIEPMMLIMSVFIFPLIINAFYTLGWIVELLLYKKHKRDHRIGPMLFAIGILFTLICIAFPALYWGIFYLIHVVIK